MFRLRTDDNVQTYCAMDFLCSQAKPSAVGSIYTTDDYSYGGNLACKLYCEENGIKFVSEGGAVGDSDFTSQILKLKDAGCEAVYLNLNAAEMVIVCRQMHELGYTPMVMAGMCASNSDFIDLVEGTEVGGWCIHIPRSALTPMYPVAKSSWMNMKVDMALTIPSLLQSLSMARFS